MTIEQFIAAASEPLQVERPAKHESADCHYEDQLDALARAVNIASSRYYTPIRALYRDAAVVEGAVKKILALPKSGTGGAERIASCVWWRVRAAADSTESPRKAARLNASAELLKAAWKGCQDACSDAAADESEAIARTLKGDFGRFVRYALATVPFCKIRDLRGRIKEEEEE